ncbi:MAG TPA: hypothetical protein DEB06_06880 [Phycisphaerales bacterium]|nr:hypothetical protein [Phycisphaerales bacterium]
MALIPRALMALVPCGALSLSIHHAAAQHDPPAGYYDSAAGTGLALKGNLHLIASKDYWNPASTTHLVRSYGDARQALALTDPDPTDPSKIVLIYTGNAVPNTWDSGVTWNREHTWPVSRQGGGESGPDYSDLHMLRPSDPGVNSSRGNDPFGTLGGFWDPLAAALLPGVNHRGEMARAMFYMDTRYDGADANTTDLSLVNGFPVGSQMGDLASMLQWHYTDPPDAEERRRNEIVFSNSLNPSYYQGNRNPFVDRPEFVWAIWGPTPNSSTLHVGPAPNPDGSSSLMVSLRALVGAPLPQQTVTLSKSGATPTSYDLSIAGGFTVDGRLQGRLFPYDPQQAALTLTALSTASPGLSVGFLTVNNTDLTSAGPGQGSADANDTVSVAVDVLTHAAASFSPAQTVTTATISAGAQPTDPPFDINIPIYNRGGGPDQAALDVDAVVGLSGPFTPINPLPTDISATPGTLTVQFDPTGLAPGLYALNTQVLVSDEDLPGAVNSMLALRFEVTIDSPCPGDANADREVDFDDITAILGHWLADYTPGTGPGDADLSGTVDFDDITAALGRWLELCP